VADPHNHAVTFLLDFGPQLWVVIEIGSGFGFDNPRCLGISVGEELSISVRIGEYP
jgi:hypothetical protein